MVDTARGEVMPWSFKAQPLLRQQYAPGWAAWQAASTVALPALQQAADGGVAVEAPSTRYQARATRLGQYAEAYRHYCWPVHRVEDMQLAPFHVCEESIRLFGQSYAKVHR
jgi:PNKP adenylyltransferase domain, ligase domain